MGAVVQLCVWSLEAPGWLGTYLHFKSRDTEMVLHSLGQEPERLGRVGQIAWVGCGAVDSWLPDLSQKQGMWDVFSLGRCEGLFRSHCDISPMETPVVAAWQTLWKQWRWIGGQWYSMIYWWWRICFLDRLYNGTEIFLSVVWRAVSIMPCLWVCISV